MIDVAFAKCTLKNSGCRFLVCVPAIVPLASIGTFSKSRLADQTSVARLHVRQFGGFLLRCPFHDAS